MAVKEDSLSKIIVMETKYQIPRGLLAILGNPSEVTVLVDRYLREVREQTLKSIPMSWRDKVVKYGVSRVKQHIFDEYRKHPEKAEFVRPVELEFMQEYASAKATADDVFDTIIYINNLRRQASIATPFLMGSITA